MGKILVLYHNKNTYYFDRINHPELSIQNVFKNEKWMHNKVLRVLRETNSALTRLFYGKWYRELNSYDKVIVFDTPFAYDKKILENIARKYSKDEKYYYSWNIVRNEELHAQEKIATDKAGFKYFCYDRGNCETYNMYFNTIMYDPSLQLPQVEPQYDTFFLGFLKDRKQKMGNLYADFLNAGLQARFVVVKRKGEVEDMPFEYRDKEVGYYEYLDMINHSRSILDITQEGQDGYSMRVMEAIYLNKKLVTTNTAIQQDVLYNPNNILILKHGATTEEEIREFFEKPFQPYPQSIREYYSFSSWAERFK